MTQAPATESRKRITLLLDLDGCEAFVEQGTTGLSIDCGGSVITRPLKDWHAIAAAPLTAAPAADRAVSELPLYLWEHDSLTSRVATVEDAKSFTDGNPRWVRCYPVELVAAPPADRAELIDALRLALAYENPKLGPTGRIVAKSVLQAAIDALARSTDAPSEPKGARCIKPQCPIDCSMCNHAIPADDELAMLVVKLLDTLAVDEDGAPIEDEESAIVAEARGWLARYNSRATPPAAATAPCIGNDPMCPCQDGDACHYRDTATTKGWPAAATSTPCASGEAHALAEEVKTAWGRNDPKRLYDALDKLERLAAQPTASTSAQEETQEAIYRNAARLSPTVAALAATQARAAGVVPAFAIGGMHVSTICGTAVPATASNTEDARSETQAELPPLPPKRGRGYCDADMRAYARAALTQAASTGGAAS